MADYTGAERCERGPLAPARDDARLWRVDALGGLELMRARFADFTFAPHAHDEFMIAVTEAGRARPWYRRSDHLHGPGDMIVLNPGEVHGGGPAAGAVWQYRSLYPRADLMALAVRELTGTERTLPQFGTLIVRDRPVATAIRRAHRALEQPASMLERGSRLLQALASLILRHAVRRVTPRPLGSEHRAVQRARDYLEAFPAENVSLEALASEAEVSAFHLCRVFRRETGFPPHAFQTLARVRRAKALLAAGAPISQAALEAGFYDQAHLTRHFKRVYGITPGRYVRPLKEPPSPPRTGGRKSTFPGRE